MNFARNFKEFDAEIHGPDGASAGHFAAREKEASVGAVGVAAARRLQP
jgi:hypothetical protein